MHSKVRTIHDPGLVSGRLAGPGKVAVLQAKSTELGVATALPRGAASYAWSGEKQDEVVAREVLASLNDQQ